MRHIKILFKAFRLSSKSCRNQGKAAFTLIEMLVVIAIIGLLASLLAPVTQKTMERGRAVSTLSNMRGIGGLMFSYAAENDGHFPWVEDRTTGNYNTQSWRYQLLTWAGGIRKNYKVLDAPSCPFRPDILAFGQTANCGYSMNQYMGESNRSGIAIKGKSTPYGIMRPTMDDFVRPSTSFVVASAGKGGSWRGNSYTHTSLWNPWFRASSKNLNDYLPVSLQVDKAGGLGYWVMDAAAMLMVDGHVERVPRGYVTWGHFYPF